MTISPHEALVSSWADVLIESAYSPMSRTRLKEHLDEHVRLLTRARAEDAEAVGEWLVAVRFTGPDSLRRTIEVLGPVLPMRVLGAVGTGYVRATRNQLFAEQEQVRASLLKAVEDAQRDLHDSQTRFAQVFVSTTAGIVIFDLDGDVVEANPALATMLGHEEQPSSKELFEPGDLAALTAECRRMLLADEDTGRKERELIRHNGDTMWANVALSVLRGADRRPKYHVAVIEDVTEQRMLQEWLRHQALTDLLTGLPNRQSFMSTLERVLATLAPHETVTLCYLDVDSLTVINDGLGYAAGDSVLKAVAQRLTSVLRDAIVARIGGDEFVALIKGAPDLAALAETIDHELSEPVYLDGHGVAVSAGIGFVHATGRGTDPLALLRRAHSTLRRAEAGGKRQWGIFDAERDEVDRARFARIAAMPGALENGEILVGYRPVTGVADGAVLALEAELRWTDLGHDECLRYAETLGLTAPLGRMMLRDACSRGEPVLVRLSPDLSRDPDLTAIVGRTLRETGLPAGSLLLAFDVRGLPDGEENLGVLADMGVRTLLHQFSGGFDGLSYVDRNPLWGVRMTRRPTAPLAQQGFAGLIQLLHSAGTLVIAEDADTPGVDYAVN